MSSNQTLIELALQLMLAGMGTVFAFLVLLVFATRCMSWLVLRGQPTVVEPDGEAIAVTAEELAAAAAAVARYRQSSTR